MIKLPEKLASMTPYDPCEDVYQIKLDANESYFSLPEELRDAIAASIDTIDFNRYPDPTVADVRRLAGREFRIAPDNIVVGNGSDELISLIMNTFAPRGARSWFCLRTFPCISSMQRSQSWKLSICLRTANLC